MECANYIQESNTWICKNSHFPGSYTDCHYKDDRCCWYCDKRDDCSAESKCAIGYTEKQCNSVDLNGDCNIYTVSIINTADPCASSWTTPFSSRAKAEAFMKKAEERIKQLGLEWFLKIDLDSMKLDSEEYLTWLDEEYGGLTNEEI